MTQEIVSFWPVFTALLAANFFTVMMIWGFYVYSKMDKENRVRDIPGPVYIGIFMPMIFLVIGFLVTFD